MRSPSWHRRGCGSPHLPDVRRDAEEREGGTHRPRRPYKCSQHPSWYLPEGQGSPWRVRLPTQGHQEGDGQLTVNFFEDTTGPVPLKRYRAFFI